MEEIKITRAQTLKEKPDPSTLVFGKAMTDHMFIVDYDAGQGWHDPRIVPYAPLQIDPAAKVLHYAQEIFEGLKAYRTEDGSIQLFRPLDNVRRMNNSAARMSLPQIPEELALAGITELVKLEQDWVPSAKDTSLYIRPFMVGLDAALGVHSSHHCQYIVIVCPVGAYYPEGLDPVKIYVEDQDVRAVKGGTGMAKTGGNYAASLLGEYTGIDNGCEQVCFVDAATKTYLEELGGMNMMVVHKDGHVETPSLTGNILPGVTRRSLIQLMQDRGIDVVETMIKLTDLLDDIKSGEVTEVFACGTAAIITPIGRFKSKEFDVTVANGESGKLTVDLRDQLLGIQLGEVEDPHNWMWKVC